MKRARDILIVILAVLIFSLLGMTVHLFTQKYIEGYALPILFSLTFLLPTIIIFVALRESPKDRRTETPKETPLQKKPDQKEKKDASKQSVHLTDLLIILSFLAFVYIFQNDIGTALRNIGKEKAQVEVEGRWFYLWERGYNPKNRAANILSAKLPVKIIIKNEAVFNFEIYYRSHGRDRIARCFTKRDESLSETTFTGTWSQGNEGDPDHDFGKIFLQEINSKKFKGFTEDKNGGKVFVSVEKM